MSARHLAVLREVLEGGPTGVPSWLERLLLHGPEPEAVEGGAPPRIRITELLAWWSKHAGLSEAQALEWLMPFCTEVLSTLSKSSPSNIRHGTKSATRYVFRSEYAMDFSSIDKETSTSTGQKALYVQVHAWWEEELRRKAEWEKERRMERAERERQERAREMEEKRKRREEGQARLRERKGTRKRREERAAQSGTKQVTKETWSRVKARFKEQFENAMSEALRQHKAGYSPLEIANSLNEHGYLTRTGREWKSNLVTLELKKLSKEDASET